MKRILIATAMCLLAFVPAASATPPANFTVSGTVNGGTSLYAPYTGCVYAPCTWVWTDMTTNTRLGSGRSLVVQFAPGNHTIQLKVSERLYRNPTYPYAFAYRDIVTDMNGFVSTGPQY